MQTVLDTNKLDLVYKKTMIENGMKKTDVARNYKQEIVTCLPQKYT